MQGTPIGLSLVFTDSSSQQTDSYGYKKIKDQLVIILGEVPSVKVVYGKEEKTLKEFPAVCISAKEHTSRFNSVGKSGGNERRYQHYIRVYFRVDERNNADYEDVLEKIADDIVQKLESNPTLNSVCSYAIPVSGMWRYGEKEVPVRIFELVVNSTAYVRRDRGILM